MSAYDTPSCNCPYCNSSCEADWVDVGVGMTQCGPYHCRNCGATEIGQFDDIGFDIELFYKWRNENYKLENINGKYKEVFIGKNEKTFKLPENATITQEEWDKGWYGPDHTWNGKKFANTVNTFNGEYVDHKTAKKLYDMGLLDEK